MSNRVAVGWRSVRLRTSRNPFPLARIVCTSAVNFGEGFIVWLAGRRGNDRGAAERRHPPVCRSPCKCHNVEFTI